MHQFVAVYAVVFGLFIFRAPAQAQDRTVADSLMDRWVEIWNAEDVDALRDFYHEDVVSADDVFGWTEVGIDENVIGTENRMQITEGLRIQRIYSYESDDKAYQIGRWTLRDQEGWSTGSHVFIFFRTADGWKLRSAYYVHDPKALMEEFPDVRR